MKILLTEGSGVTSRQVAGRLAAMGHQVEVLTSDPMCLARFTRHVRRLHRVPAYGEHPLVWLAAALSVFESGGFDVLFPTQEQVAVLSAAGVGAAVPTFSALSAVQDKLSAFDTLGRLGLPQPAAVVVSTGEELRAWNDFPVYVKQPIGTATTGVRKVERPADLADIEVGVGVLVQQVVDGPLAMVQSVFDRGRLVASHANLRVRLGASGGASHKRSIDHDEIRAHLVTLGADLGWHGALSADVILGGEGPTFIDINPRIVEPMNAWRSGVDLVGALLEVSLGNSPAVQPPGSPGWRTHQTVLAVGGAVQQGRGRRGVACELVAAARHRGDYADSVEEMTPWRGDRRSAIPLVMASVATLVRPAAWQWFSTGSVAAYALTPAGWAEILAARSAECSPQ